MGFDYAMLGGGVWLALAIIIALLCLVALPQILSAVWFVLTILFIPIDILLSLFGFGSNFLTNKLDKYGNSVKRRFS